MPDPGSTPTPDPYPSLSPEVLEFLSAPGAEERVRTCMPGGELENLRAFYAKESAREDFKQDLIRVLAGIKEQGGEDLRWYQERFGFRYQLEKENAFKCPNCSREVDTSGFKLPDDLHVGEFPLVTFQLCKRCGNNMQVSFQLVGKVIGKPT